MSLTSYQTAPPCNTGNVKSSVWLNEEGRNNPNSKSLVNVIRVENRKIVANYRLPTRGSTLRLSLFQKLNLNCKPLN